MKRKSKLLFKQSIKYILIIVVALVGLFLGKIIWNLPLAYHLWGVAITGIIILIAFIIDMLSVKDIIPILKN